MSEQQQLESVIAGLEAQRALLGDAIVDAALGPMQARLAALAATAMPAGASTAQALKIVTMLFTDMVNSTQLAERMDAEDMLELSSDALARLAAVVEAHQGRVLRYTGDGLKAVFGADTAQEDDPERAVRCGLALVAAAREHAGTVRPRWPGADFDIRVGIHTGAVALGGGIEGSDTAMGSAVNLAARMEQAAPPGGLRISHDTYRHVRGIFDVETQPPLHVKGVDEPVATYLVLGAKPRAFRVATRGIEGIETRMVGRDAELEQLQDAFKRVCSQGKLSVITVIADAGIGKSRLLYEFRNWAEARPEAFKVFQGRATPQTQNQPYGLLRDILAWRLQIADNDSMDAAKAKLEYGIVPLFADNGDDMAQAHAHLLGHLIGLDFSDSRHVRGILDDARQIRDRGFHAATQMFRRVIDQDNMPVVLQLDDLHWADEGSLDFLNQLTQINRDLPMVVLALARPTLFERRGDWCSTGCIRQRIDLGPLNKDASRLLAGELLKKLPEIPAALRELIIDGADGNPFYMEELVKMLVDEGAIKTGVDRWTVDSSKLVAARVPPTLSGVLQARLDSLNPAEKLALQQASVIGIVFWDQMLADIDARAVDAIPALERRELIVPHPDTSLEGVREYAFKHQILHQVTYDTVLKRDKRELHMVAANWLVTRTGGRVDEHVGLIADHYERAGDMANAAQYLRRAAEAAFDAAAYVTALGHIDRALALAPATDQRTRFDLFAVRLNVYNVTGRRAEQAGDVATQERIAEALDDDWCRAKAARSRSLLALATGDYLTAVNAADRAQAPAALVVDPETALGALLDKGQALIYMGDSAAAQACLESLLTLARVGGRADIECLAMNRLNAIAQDRGDFVAARAYLVASLAIAHASGNRRIEGGLSGNLGLLETRLGNYAAARELLQAGLDVARAIGDRVSEIYALWGVAAVALEQGDAPTALSIALEGRDIAREVADPNCEAACILVVGAASAELGHAAQAIACFDEYEDWARQKATGKALPPPMAARAELELSEGRLDEALALVTQIAAWLDANPDVVDEDRLKRLFVCHRVLAAVGVPRADEFLARSHATLQSQVQKLPDADRTAYLGNIRLHRDIEAAFSSIASSAIRPS